MKNKYFFLINFFCVFLISQTTYTWTNSGGDFYFSNPNNWIPAGGPPGPADGVVFDGNYTIDDCIVDMPVSVSGFTMLSGYTGNFDASTNGNDVEIFNEFIIEQGNFIPPDPTSGFVFNFYLHTSSSSGTISIGNNGSIQQNGYVFDVYCAGNSTVFIDNSGPPFEFIRLRNSEVTLSSSQRNFIFTTLPSVNTQSLSFIGSRPISVQGVVNINRLLDLSGHTNTSNPSAHTATLVFDGSSPKTIRGANTNNRSRVPNLYFSTSSTVTFSNNINTYNSNITIINAGGLTTNTTQVLNLYGNNSISTPSSAAFSHNAINRRFRIHNVNITSTGTLNMGNGDFLHITGNYTNNGVFNGTSQSIIGLAGTTNQTISGSSSNTFGILFIPNTNTRTIQINSGVTILDSLKIISKNVTLNTGGNLRIHSTNSLKGRIAMLGDGTSSSMINGNITVRTFATGGTTGWTNLGVSGVSGNNLSAWDGQIPMTCNGCINGTTSAGGPFISVYRYHEPGSGGAEYDPMTASSPLNPGEGYWVYLGNGQNTTSDMTWTVSGAAVQGSVTVNLTNTSGSAYPGFNLIANPYPSPIEFRRLMAVGSNSSNITNVTYIYNPDLGLSTSYNGVSNVSSHSAGAKDVIPMGQGFHVEANTNTTFVFAEIAKSYTGNTSSNQLLKTSNTNSNSLIRLSLTSPLGSWDETVIYLHPNATANEDLMDAKKIFPNSFNTSTASPDPKKATISTKSLNKDFSINSLPLSINGYTIPVLAKTPVSGVFKIEATELVDFPPGTCLNLKDKYTNTIHNLNNGPYLFNLHDSTQAPRFELIVCGGWLPTGVTDPLPKDPASFVQIIKGENGLYFSGTYLNGSHIRITNLLGQILYENNSVNAPDNKFDLPFRTSEKLIIVTVQTKNEKVSRKFVN